jgi:hypothetical protein
MKQVFSSHSEVAHIWAQRSQQQGTAGNIFFEKNKIYSYGYHYELARFEKSHVVINDTGYSVSTSKHIGIVRGAVSHYEEFLETKINTKLILQELENSWLKIQKAKKPGNYWEFESNPLSRFETYLTKFDKVEQQAILAANKDNLKAIKNILKKLNNFVSNPNIKALVSANIKAEQKQKRKEQEKKRKEAEQAIKDFQTFEKDSIAWHHNLGNTAFLRFNGETVETSKGIKIEGRKAFILFSMIEQGKDIKGYKIDHYTVISMNGKLKVGCHEIDKSEVFRVGKQLKKAFD